MTQTPELPTRVPTAVDAVADQYLDTFCRLNPFAATAMGVSGYDHLATDLSPAGWDAMAGAAREVLAELATGEAKDDVDRVTIAAMQERLGLEVALHEADEWIGQLNNIASPVQELRDIFDIMPTSTPEHWENIALRLAALPDTAAGVVESLRLAASRGRVAPIRQVTECITQASELANAGSFFDTFVTGAEVDAALDDSAACQAIRKALGEGAESARRAYGQIAEFLRDELAPQAPQDDAAGRERYPLWSQYFLGARVDLEETYEWGLAELARVVAEQEAVAAEIAGSGASVADAVAKLDADPTRRLDGTEALRAWMQETSDGAIAALNGVHFDIPDPVLRLECRIAPTQSGGIYYTGPSDDF